MTPQEVLKQSGSRADEEPEASESTRTARRLVVRNYDRTDAHTLRVRFLDAENSVVLERSYRLAPLETVVVRARLERAVYRVEARTDDVSDSADCLVGHAPSETALVETGNGTVSVVEGPTR